MMVISHDRALKRIHDDHFWRAFVQNANHQQFDRGGVSRAMHLPRRVEDDFARTKGSLTPWRFVLLFAFENIGEGMSRMEMNGAASGSSLDDGDGQFFVIGEGGFEEGGEGDGTDGHVKMILRFILMLKMELLEESAR